MQDEYVPFGAAWFTLSLINAGLAQGKRRSGFNWWLLSLFLGPFATFLIVALPPGGAAAERPADAMTRTQAVVVGIVIIALVLGVVGLVRFGN